MPDTDELFTLPGKLQREAFHGMELVPDTRRLALMSLNGEKKPS